MVYLEIQLTGHARFYEIADEYFLTKAAIDARAACLPIPPDIDAARHYVSSTCCQFEMFHSMSEAAAWVEGYGGFRAREVYAEFRRFSLRRAYVPERAAA